MNTKFTAFLNRIQEIHDLEKASAVLAWDREVNMPKDGSAIRTIQMTTLQKMRHNLFVSDEMGDLIGLAEESLNGSGYDTMEASLVRYIKRDYEETKRIPADYVQRVGEVNGKAIPAWKEARATNNFLYLPHIWQPSLSWLKKKLNIGGMKTKNMMRC